MTAPDHTLEQFKNHLHKWGQWYGPRRPRAMYLGNANRRVHAMENKRIGLDLAQYVFEVHAVDNDENVVLRKTLRRDAVAQFFAEL